MKKKSVNLAVSLGILAVMCGAYLGVKQYQARLENEKEADEEEKAEVISASSDEISSVKFLVNKTEVTFEKTEGEWRKSDETEFPVDQDILSEAVGGLSMLEADRVLENVEDLSEYELDQPVNTITVELTDGSQTSLRVGMENEGTSQYYVEKDGDASIVYVVDSSVIEPFMKSLYDYAKQENFPTIDSTLVQSVQVEKGDSGYGLFKNESTSLWEIQDEDDMEKADSAKATSLISTLTSFSYQSLVNYRCEDLSEYGLENPYGKIEIKYQEEIPVEDEEESGEENLEEAETSEDSDDLDEEEAEETKRIDQNLVILIGNGGENNTRYVKVGDSDEIYTISEESISAVLDKSKSDFWDLTVNYLSVNDLDELHVSYDKDHVINVSRETSETNSEDEEPSTTLTYQIDGKELDSLSFHTFYNKVINMAGQKRLTEEFKTTSKADMVIALTDTKGTCTEISYYPYDTNFYAAVNGEKVFLVNKMTVKEMMEAFETMLEDHAD